MKPGSTPWTAQEIALLRQHWPKMGKRCAGMFDRTYGSIRNKAGRLGIPGPVLVIPKAFVVPKLREEGLRNRLLSFLKNNDEELYAADISAKFGVARKTVEGQLTYLKQAGLIEVVRVVRLRHGVFKEAA